MAELNSTLMIQGMVLAILNRKLASSSKPYEDDSGLHQCAYNCNRLAEVSQLSYVGILKGTSSCPSSPLQPAILSFSTTTLSPLLYHRLATSALQPARVPVSTVSSCPELSATSALFTINSSRLFSSPTPAHLL